MNAKPAFNKRDAALTALALAVLYLFLWWADGSMAGALSWSFLPSPLNGYEIQILNLVAVYGILAISLNIIYGFTGMFSLGHAGFMAIGAYVSALCVLSPEQKEIMWIIDEILPPLAALHTPFWFSVILGGVVATIFALFIGIPVLRLGGDYLGIATLGTIATCTWIAGGLLIQKFYLRHYRPINGLLSLALLECAYSMLR